MGWQPTKWDSMPFFLRPPSTTLVGPGATARIPASTEQFDWECELAVFVGRRLREVARQEAGAAIVGYAIGLDLSCRDLIQVDNDLKVDLVRGKAQDRLAPCGPWITPAAFAGDVDDLRVQLWVNEQQMMDASTTEMLFKVDEGVLKFGAKGLRLTTDNKVEGVAILTADDEVAILNEASVSDLGTLMLRDVCTTGQVLLLAQDAVRSGTITWTG